MSAAASDPLQLQFVGSGDAFGSGGRFNTCMRLVRSAGDVLIDCGASSMIALRRLGIPPNSIETIIISHLHGDHFGGLPFFILDAQFYSGRDKPLSLVGPPGFRERLKDAMEIFFPGSSTARRKFEIEVHTLAPDTQTTINNVGISCLEVKHACGAPPLGLRVDCDGKAIAYSGDTEWTDALIELARDADLFIVEALFFEKKIPHHLDYMSFKENADRISAKRTILTHCGPDMLARADEAAFDVAEDGLIIDIP